MKLDLFFTLPLCLCIQFIIAKEEESVEKVKRQASFNGGIDQNTINQISIGEGFFRNQKRRVARQFVNQFSVPIVNNFQNNATSVQEAADFLNSFAIFFNNSSVAPQPEQQSKQVVPARPEFLNQVKTIQNAPVKSNGVSQQSVTEGIKNNQTTQVRQKKKINPFRNQIQSIQL
ncbi:unnamed protein product [Brachionus calyciflorus]|uniref:Uncharacterized protein n=1 Tax=Brachionus calyciflorus TaxID=104777 RepID=A0A814D6D7_9BILA|nr:unnamed protein product [Brachionus calyciflorus]